MNYFLSVGEASADLHGAELIKQLKVIDPTAEFEFLGGDMMATTAGVKPLIHIREMSVMGFLEVLKKLPKILNHFKKTKRFLNKNKPDAVILVDYPSYNLKLAKYAHKLGIKVYWYISPKVWVWKEKRVKRMKKYIDRLFSILPFEKDYFLKKHKWEIDYVGNPSAEEVNDRIEEIRKISIEDFLSHSKINTDKPILALVPGSRVKEIESNLHVMIEVAKNYPQFHPVVAKMSAINPEIYDRFSRGMDSVFDQTFNLLGHSAGALVTSGTATLETALLGVPQVMLYRDSGSKLLYKLGRRLLKVKYFSLPNLINNKETIPELVMHYCTPKAVSEAFSKVIEGGDRFIEQQQDYELLRSKLGQCRPSQNVANLILKDITANKPDFL